jgi:hypothetical protein
METMMNIDNLDSDLEVKVYDGLCGSGKTTLISKIIKSTEASQKIIFITPYLKECHRIAGTEYIEDTEGKIIPQKDEKGNFIYSHRSDYADFSKEFAHPEDSETSKFQSKQQSLQALIKSNRNIVCTHATFLNLKTSTIKLIKDKNYHLIIDESISLIEPFKVKMDTMNYYLDSGFVEIKKDGKLHWKSTKKHSGIDNFKTERIAIKKGKIFRINDTTFMNIMPITAFECFKNISIFTYLFEGTTLNYYFQLFKISPDIIELETHQHTGKLLLKKYSDIIKIETSPKYNSIGEKRETLSATWSKNKKNKEKIKELSSLYASFFRKHSSTSEDCLWTSFKSVKSAIQYQGHHTNFITFNAKAFNHLKDKKNLAYMVNVFLDPNLKKFLESKDVEVNGDYYSLSEMIQWIFRSRIRESHLINIYIPSKRMRDLLQHWIHYEDMKHHVATNPSDFPGLKIIQINLDLHNDKPCLGLYINEENYTEDIKVSEKNLVKAFPNINITLYVLNKED